MSWTNVWSELLYKYYRVRRRPPNVHGVVEVRLNDLDKDDILKHVQIVSATSTWDAQPLSWVGAAVDTLVEEGRSRDMVYAARAAIKGGKRTRCFVQLRSGGSQPIASGRACLLELTREKVMAARCRVRIRVWHREPLIGRLPTWTLKWGGLCGSGVCTYCSMVQLGVGSHEAVSGALLVMLAVGGAAHEALRHKAL